MSALWQVPAVVLSLVAWLSSPPSGLGDVAQREALRRNATPKSTASLTNLGQAPEPPPVAAVSLPAQEAPPPAPPATTPAQEVQKPAGEGKDEQWWRARITAARTAVERGQVMADALQSRINALQADVVNIDDPVQQAKARQELGKALGELERVKDQIEADRKNIAAIQEEARRLDVPPGWIR